MDPVYQEASHAFHRSMQRALAGGIRYRIDLSVGEQHFAPAIGDQARMQVVEHLLDAGVTAANVFGTHTRDGRNNIDLQLRTTEIAPSGNEYLVRNKVLDLTLQQKEKLVMMRDLGGVPNDA